MYEAGTTSNKSKTALIKDRTDIVVENNTFQYLTVQPRWIVAWYNETFSVRIRLETTFFLLVAFGSAEKGGKRAFYLLIRPFAHTI